MKNIRIKWIVRGLVWLGCAILGAALIFAQGPPSRSVSPMDNARKEISRGELETAEQKLWVVLSSKPDDSEALTLLAIIRGRQKRYPEAEALLHRSLQIDPHSVTARRNLASALIAQNRPDAAIAEYREVVQLSPGDATARDELARLYLAGGKFADALSTLDGIPANRLPAEAIPTRAASLLGVGKKQEASALIARVKEWPAIASELAEVFLDANAPEYTLRTVNAGLAALKRPPARLYYLRGRALEATGDSAGGLSSMRQALEREPNSIDFLLGIAQLQASQGKHRESLSILKRAYALQGDSVAVLRPVVIEASEVGERKVALRAAHVLAEKSPDNLDDLYLAAVAMLEAREFPAAASILEKYVVARPAEAKGFLGLGIAEVAQQRYPEAKKVLEQALRMNPSLADAEYQLGAVADQQGAAAEAMQHFERAVQIKPQHARALAGLGRQYLQSGDLEKAHSFLTRSLASDPYNYKAEYDLALVLAKQGQSAEAKEHMERSQALKVADDAGNPTMSAPANP